MDINDITFAFWEGILVGFWIGVFTLSFLNILFKLAQEETEKKDD